MYKLLISQIINVVLGVYTITSAWQRSVSALTYPILHSLFIIFFRWNHYLPTKHFFSNLLPGFPSTKNTPVLWHLSYFITVYQHVFLAYMTQNVTKPSNTSRSLQCRSDGFSQYWKVCIQRFWVKNFIAQQTGHLYPHSCLLLCSLPCWLGGFETDESLDNLLLMLILGLAIPMAHDWIGLSTASCIFTLILSVICNRGKEICLHVTLPGDVWLGDTCVISFHLSLGKKKELVYRCIKIPSVL